MPSVQARSSGEETRRGTHFVRPRAAKRGRVIGPLAIPARSPSLSATVMPWTAEAHVDTGMGDPAPPPSHRMPRMANPDTVVERADAPGGDVPGPPVGRRVEIRVGHPFHLRGPRPVGDPDPAVLRGVDPPSAGGSVDPLRFRRGRLGGPRGRDVLRRLRRQRWKRPPRLRLGGRGREGRDGRRRGCRPDGLRRRCGGSGRGRRERRWRGSHRGGRLRLELSTTTGDEERSEQTGSKSSRVHGRRE